MRKDWAITAIGNVCEIVNGGTPKTGVAEYWGGDHLWITPAEMGKRRSPYVDETARTLTKLGLQDSSARLLPPLSVILSSRAPIGHLVINTKEMATNQGCKGLVPNKHLDHKFLFYYLGSIVGLLNDLGTGTTFKEISGGRLKEVPLPLPSLPEQKRIVAILDEAFEGIGTAIVNAEKNVADARELFQSYLNSVFIRRGKGWTDTTLEHVLAEQPRNGWSPPAENHADAGVPVLTLSSVTGFRFRPNKIKFTSATVDPHRHYWVKNGDFLLTRSNTPELVGHVAIAAGIIEPTIYPDLIMRMNTATDHMLTKFLYYQMRTTALRQEITGRAQGANPTMKKVSKGAVQSLPIAVPLLPQQKEIVAELDTLSIETQRLESVYEQKLTNLTKLKHAALQKAFAGELTARSIEAVQEAAE